jgi:hypothetical protein
MPPLTPPVQPIFYAPPPPPPRRRTGEMTSVVDRTQGSLTAGRVLLLLFLLALGTAALAAVIHVAVVPLEVLVVWTQPARLHVRSNPGGAEVFLDGQRLSARTPTYTEVTRDRKNHNLEVRAEGHEPETRQIRYDRTVNLEETLDLRRSSAPAIEPVAPAPAEPPAPAATPAEAPTAPSAGAAAETTRRSRGKARAGKATRKAGKGARKSKAAPSAGPRSAQ